MAHLQQFRELPASAEGRLGGDHERNRTIVDSVLSLPMSGPFWSLRRPSITPNRWPDRWRFAVLPSSLSRQSRTRMPGDRPLPTFATDAFRSSRVAGVLTTGFDAPSTRALYVTRPVYSPGLYQQMIGRGLRGPANGGTERCLIVNVQDNVMEYGEELAFRYFEHLWQQS